jgi:hypothetical protein
VDSEKVGEDFYGLAEVVGLAMRKSAKCLVEINLMPPELVQKKTFRKRIPFLAVGAVAIVGAVALLGLVSHNQLGLFERQRAEAKKERRSYDGARQEVKDKVAESAAVERDIGLYAGLIRQRTVMSQRFDSLRSALLDGMWLVSVEPVQEGEGGAITKLSITGRGFIDKLRKAEDSVGTGATAVEIFRDRLAAQPAFTNDVKSIEIVSQTDAAGLKAKVKEFKLLVGIAPDCVFGKDGE